MPVSGSATNRSGGASSVTTHQPPVRPRTPRPTAPHEDEPTVPRSLLRPLMPSLALRGAPLDLMIHTIVQSDEGRLRLVLDHDRSTQRGVNARRVAERATGRNDIDTYRLTVEALHVLGPRDGTSHLISDVAREIIRQHPDLDLLYAHVHGDAVASMNSRINGLHRHGDLPTIYRELHFDREVYDNGSAISERWMVRLVTR